MMVSTDPSRIPSVLLITPFLLIFTILVLLVMVVLRWQGLSMLRSLRLAIMSAVLPTLVLVLQTLGQLTIRDLLTIAALFAITYFYLSRITKPSSE